MKMASDIIQEKCEVSKDGEWDENRSGEMKLLNRRETYGVQCGFAVSVIQSVFVGRV
jgi:hypothetical protein